MLRAITTLAATASLQTNQTNVQSIGCDICTFALEKAFEIGCGAGAAALSAICLDAEPACLAAFEVLCSVCDKDCNVGCWSQWACAHVDLCPSTTCAIEINYANSSSTSSTMHPSDPTTTTNNKQVESTTATTGNTYYETKKFLRRKTK